MMLTIGDKVRIIDQKRHLQHPEWYPEVGTVGTVGTVVDLFLPEMPIVKWPDGSTSGNEEWAISPVAIKLVERSNSHD